MKLALTSTLALAGALAACGGKSSSEPVKPSPATAATPGTPPPAQCPSVIYACTDPAVGCFEGGEDFKAAMGPECKKSGGIEAGHCDPAGTLGSCTVLGKLTPTFNGCGTMWMKKGMNIQTPDDGKTACDKFGGTWTTTP